MMVEFLFEESFNNRPLLGKNDGSFFFPPQKILQLLNYNLALLCPEPTLTPFAFRGFGTPASSFPLEFPGAETPKPIHAKPIRGFVYRDFTTCGDKGSCPLVSRVPKRRKPFSR
jgi:hypothetical protein